MSVRGVILIETADNAEMPSFLQALLRLPNGRAIDFPLHLVPDFVKQRFAVLKMTGKDYDPSIGVAFIRRDGRFSGCVYVSKAELQQLIRLINGVLEDDEDSSVEQLAFKFS